MKARIVMKIKILSQDALNTLKGDLKKYLPCFEEDTNALLLATLKNEIGQEPLIETNYTLPDKLVLDSSAIGQFGEVEEVKKVYGALRKLPRSIACDARLWAGLTIDKFWTFTKNRWKMTENVVENGVLDHFLFMGQSKKAYTRNAISRLWWIGSLTYDEMREDPYEVSSFVLKDSAYVVDLLERDFSNSKKIVSEFICAIEDVCSAGFNVRSRKYIRPLCRYLNLLGGVYILDAFPEGEIYRKVYEHAEKLWRANNG